MLEYLDVRFESYDFFQSYSQRQAEYQAYIKNPALIDGEDQVDDDGNCLFHSILPHLKRCHEDFSHNAQDLRIQAIDWIKGNYETDEVLQKYLLEVMSDFFVGEYERAGRNNELSPEEQEQDQKLIMMEKVMPAINALAEGDFSKIQGFIEDYCEILKTREEGNEGGKIYRPFAGPPEAYALCRKYEIVLTMHKKTNGGLDVEVAPQNIGVASEYDPCNITYSGTHFNPYFPS